MFALGLVMIFTACEKAESAQKLPEVGSKSKLEQRGLLGNWKIEDYARNGISSAAKACCAQLELMADTASDDLRGIYVASDVGSESKGVFRLGPSGDKIEFSRAGRQVVYELELKDDLMSFRYTEDHDTIVEYWRKEE